MQHYNGHICCRAAELSSNKLELFTDAAGSCCFGSVFCAEWCASSWPKQWVAGGLCRNLTLLELFPIIVAIEISGTSMQDRSICFWTNNMSVVHSINGLTSSCTWVLSLLRHLVFRCLEWNIWFRARQVPVHVNVVADSCRASISSHSGNITLELGRPAARVPPTYGTWWTWCDGVGQCHMTPP